MNQKNGDGLKLDIACGKSKQEGYTGVDIWEGADIVCNLEEFPWPFADESVDEIYCSHYIEHTPDLIAFANEIYRIMKNGAKAYILAPYYSSVRAWQDPTHVRAISENTFLYFDKEWRLRNNLDHYPITADFDFKFRLDIDQDWSNKSEEELKFAIRHYINVVSNIYVVMTKRKPLDDRLVRLAIQATDSWNDGNHVVAVEKCAAFFESGEDNVNLRLMQAQHALDNLNYEYAISLFEQAIANDRDSFQAHVGLLMAYFNSGHLLEAEAHLKNIKQYDSELSNSVEECVDQIKSFSINSDE